MVALEIDADSRGKEIGNATESSSQLQNGLFSLPGVFLDLWSTEETVGEDINSLPTEPYPPDSFCATLPDGSCPQCINEGRTHCRSKSSRNHAQADAFLTATVGTRRLRRLHLGVPAAAALILVLVFFGLRGSSRRWLLDRIQGKPQSQTQKSVRSIPLYLSYGYFLSLLALGGLMGAYQLWKSLSSASRLGIPFLPALSFWPARLASRLLAARFLWFQQHNTTSHTPTTSDALEACGSEKDHKRSLPATSRLGNRPVVARLLPWNWFPLGRADLASDRGLTLTVRYFSNGNRYEGQADQGDECTPGKMAGFGVYIFAGGGRYEGEWVGGRQEGVGTEIWGGRGWKYAGEYRAGQRDGRGVCEWGNGDSYAGQWARGQSHGVGVRVCADGSKYCGEFAHGARHGCGIYSFCNGDRYEGEYFGDRMHGFGVYHFANGHRYEGAWHNGQKQGLGAYSFNSGEQRAGQWHLGALLKPAKSTLPALTGNGSPVISSHLEVPEEGEGGARMRSGSDEGLLRTKDTSEGGRVEDRTFSLSSGPSNERSSGSAVEPRETEKANSSSPPCATNSDVPRQQQGAAERIAPATDGMHVAVDVSRLSADAQGVSAAGNHVEAGSLSGRAAATIDSSHDLPPIREGLVHVDPSIRIPPVGIMPPQEAGDRAARGRYHPGVVPGAVPGWGSGVSSEQSSRLSRCSSLDSLTSSAVSLEVEPHPAVVHPLAKAEGGFGPYQYCSDMQTPVPERAAGPDAYAAGEAPNKTETPLSSHEAFTRPAYPSIHAPIAQNQGSFGGLPDAHCLPASNLAVGQRYHAADPQQEPMSSPKAPSCAQAQGGFSVTRSVSSVSPRPEYPGLGHSSAGYGYPGGFGGGWSLPVEQVVDMSRVEAAVEAARLAARKARAVAQIDEGVAVAVAEANQAASVARRMAGRALQRWS